MEYIFRIILDEVKMKFLFIEWILSILKVVLRFFENVYIFIYN